MLSEYITDTTNYLNLRWMAGRIFKNPTYSRSMHHNVGLFMQHKPSQRQAGNASQSLTKACAPLYN
jgi:hypothetical protein